MEKVGPIHQFTDLQLRLMGWIINNGVEPKEIPIYRQIVLFNDGRQGWRGEGVDKRTFSWGWAVGGAATHIRAWRVATTIELNELEELYDRRYPNWNAYSSSHVPELRLEDLCREVRLPSWEVTYLHGKPKPDPVISVTPDLIIAESPSPQINLF